MYSKKKKFERIHIISSHWFLCQIPITPNGSSEMDEWLECFEMRFKTQVRPQVNQTFRIMIFRRVNELWVLRSSLPESWYVANLQYFNLWKAFYDSYRTASALQPHLSKSESEGREAADNAAATAWRLPNAQCMCKFKEIWLKFLEASSHV